MEDKRTPVSDIELFEFQKEIGVALPQGYIDFLKVVDGGVVDEDNNLFYSVPKDFDDDCVELFSLYALVKGGEYQTVRSNYFCYQGRIPSGLLAIGEDGFGNQICINCDSKKLGQIYFWNHENLKIYPLASNLSNFFKGLRCERPN